MFTKFCRESMLGSALLLLPFLMAQTFDVRATAAAQERTDVSEAAIAEYLTALSLPTHYKPSVVRDRVVLVREIISKELELLQQKLAIFVEREEEHRRRTNQTEEQWIQAFDEICKSSDFSVGSQESLLKLMEACALEQQRLQWEATATAETHDDQSIEELTSALEMRAAKWRLQALQARLTQSRSDLEKAKSMHEQKAISSQMVAEVETKLAADVSELEQQELRLEAIALKRSSAKEKLALALKATDVRSKVLQKHMSQFREQQVAFMKLNRIQSNLARLDREANAIADEKFQMETKMSERKLLLQAIEAGLKQPVEDKDSSDKK